jgi:hypothetical protein
MLVKKNNRALPRLMITELICRGDCTTIRLDEMRLQYTATPHRKDRLVNNFDEKPHAGRKCPCFRTCKVVFTLARNAWQTLSTD